jgi:hypothetical protein
MKKLRALDACERIAPTSVSGGRAVTYLEQLETVKEMMTVRLCDKKRIGD